MKANSYTQRKHDILSGKIPVEALSSRALAEILKTAIAIGDQEIADMIEPVLAEKKEEVRQRRNRRQIEYYHSVVKPYKEAHPEAKSELMPAKVKSNEYTEYQKKIVRGEIPYEKARTRDLVLIAAIARAKEDFELANMMEDLAREKHADAIERNRTNARESYYKKRGLDPSDPNSRRSYLFGWEKDIIESRTDPDDYELDTLESVLEVAKRMDNETAVRVMEFLIAVRCDPSVIYAAKTKEDALAIIEANTIFPLRHPDEWFKNE